MLLSFAKEYELYALLSFEAALMNDGHLLAAMIHEHNSLTIKNLIDDSGQPGGLTASQLAQELTQFIYEEKTVKDTDATAIHNTCHTSILEPAGLVPFLSNPAHQGSLWLQTRPSYPGRTDLLPSLVEVSCGGNLGNGANYQRFVLNPLN
jgi:hypothetical protein